MQEYRRRSDQSSSKSTMPHARRAPRRLLTLLGIMAFCHVATAQVTSETMQRFQRFQYLFETF
eukprot:jgi/Botrbrau1/10840/Bobra.0025s0019.1